MHSTDGKNKQEVKSYRERKGTRYMHCASSGALELELSQEEVDSVPASGAADQAIAELILTPHIAEQLQTFDAEEVRKELGEFGAWDENELDDHAANLERWLWLACADCHDRPEDFRETE